MNRRKLTMVLVAMVLGLVCIPAAQAASIAWDSVFEVFTDGDIDLSGTVVSAINGGPAGAADIDVNIGGTVVTFVSPDPALYAGADFGAGGIPEVASTGNAELDEVFESHTWVGDETTLPIPFTMQGLNPGQNYQVQIFAAVDGRSCCLDRTQTFQDTEDGLGNVSGPLGRSSDLTGSGQLWANSVIGTFTADAAEQSVWIMGDNDPGVSGYILSSAGGGASTGVQLIAISGNQETNPELDESIFSINMNTAKPKFIKQLTHIPDGDAIGWNPVDELLYHTSGDSSWSDGTDSNGYRDNEYMETYDMETGEIVAIYNANPPPADAAPDDISVWGLPAPRPDWVLPEPRRTVAQTDSMWKNEPGVGQGPDEIGQIRGMAWSQAEQLWYVSAGDGLFKATPEGGAEFVGQPEDDPDTEANESSGLKGISLYKDPVTNQQRYLVGIKRDMAIWDIDTETGQLSNRVAVTLVDENGTQVDPDDGDGILALAQDPVTGTLYGMDRHPDNEFLGRRLFTLDPETGVGTVIGVMEVRDGDTAMASLQFTGWLVGDINGDGDVNGLDVDPFVDVLLNGSTEFFVNLKADMNGDGEVNGLDVDPFVAAVVGGGVQAVPEPSTFVLAGLALLGLVWYRRRN